jgi:hypothetical protein
MGGKAELVTGLILDLNPDAELKAIAKVIGRSPASIVRYVEATRDMLRYSAPTYLRLHRQAATIAAANGNAAPSQWALERIDAVSETGEIVRVVEPLTVNHQGASSVEGGLTVNVGINLSQVAPTPAPQIGTFPRPSLPLEGEAIDATPIESDS